MLLQLRQVCRGCEGRDPDPPTLRRSWDRALLLDGIRDRLRWRPQSLVPQGRLSPKDLAALRLFLDAHWLRLLGPPRFPGSLGAEERARTPLSIPNSA